MTPRLHSRSFMLAGLMILMAGSSADARAQVGQLTPGQVETPRAGGAGVGPGIEAMDPEDTRRPPTIPAGALLDRPISRTEYDLGPSDVLTLSIFGFRNQIYDLTVTPEGSVVIPTVGVAQVGGMNLEEAQREVARQVRRFYQGADVNLSLSAIRSFKVFVVGDLPGPGVREATPITRVSELIPSTNPDGVVYRNVAIQRAQGGGIQVDLARFLQLGDLSQNPTVRAGDVVQVPTVDKTITVFGEVAHPGVYEYRPNESLADLLRIANGGGAFRSDAADTLRLMRFVDSRKPEVIPISQADAAGTAGEKLVLQPFDAVFVPQVAHYMRHTTANVSGEVQRPGRYPIQPNVTTVRDLVEMAGGFTPDASLVDAILQRKPVDRRSDNNGLMSIPPEFLSEDELRLLQVTRRAGGQNVVIDFQTLFTEEGAAYDLPLEDGDQLHIPEHREEIVVLGAVGQPGIVGYRTGRPLEYFVDLAGGYTERADRGEVVVLKARLGTQLHREDQPVLEPGDRIIVPFREHRTFLERMQTVQGVVGTVSGLILTVIGLERLWN